MKMHLLKSFGDVDEVNVKKNSAVFLQGDPCMYVYEIQKGFLKIVLDTPLGSQVLLDIKGPGDFVGHLSMSLINHPYSAIALSPLKCAKILKSTYLASQKREVGVAARSIESLAAEAELYLQCLSLEYEGKVENRLMTFFSRMASRFGHLENDVVIIPFMLERKELAMAVNCRTETLIRLIRKWETAGLIKTDKKRYSIFQTRLASNGERKGWICDQCALYRKDTMCIGCTKPAAL